MCYDRKVEDLQFRVEEESITKGDLEVSAFFLLLYYMFTTLLGDDVYFFSILRISVKITEEN